MEKWECPDCNYKIPIEVKTCPSCGYKGTSYDFAAAAEDTGQYLLEELSVSVDRLEIPTPSWLKISLAIVIGVGVGTTVIVFLKLFVF